MRYWKNVFVEIAICIGWIAMLLLSVVTTAAVATIEFSIIIERECCCWTFHSVSNFSYRSLPYKRNRYSRNWKVIYFFHEYFQGFIYLLRVFFLEKWENPSEETLISRMLFCNVFVTTIIGNSLIHSHSLIWKQWHKGKQEELDTKFDPLSIWWAFVCSLSGA